LKGSKNSLVRRRHVTKRFECIVSEIVKFVGKIVIFNSIKSANVDEFNNVELQTLTFFSFIKMQILAFNFGKKNAKIGDLIPRKSRTFVFFSINFAVLVF
jgi:hypothetical protein